MKALLILIVLAACAWFGYQALTPQAPPTTADSIDVRTGDWMRVLMKDANTVLSGPLSQGDEAAVRMANSVHEQVMASAAVQASPAAQKALQAYWQKLQAGIKSVEDLQSRILAVDTEKQSLTDDTPRNQWVAARKKRILQQWEPMQKRIAQDLKMAEDNLLKALPDDILIKTDDSLIHLRDELDSLLIARPAQAPLPGNP
jgi:hypothetical protein